MKTIYVGYALFLLHGQDPRRWLIRFKVKGKEKLSLFSFIYNSIKCIGVNIHLYYFIYNCPYAGIQALACKIPLRFTYTTTILLQVPCKGCLNFSKATNLVVHIYSILV